MNRKGFTLVEMLATIVILSVVMGIASYGVLHVIDSSKQKTEEVFINKLNDAFESYISLNSSDFKNGGTFTLSDLVKDGLIDKDSFINPTNKRDCYAATATVSVYQTDDYVNYYDFDLKELNCDIDYTSNYLGDSASNPISNMPVEEYEKKSNLKRE